MQISKYYGTADEPPQKEWLIVLALKISRIPVLAFEVSLYQLANQFQLPYLAFKAAVGLWTAFFLAICSLTSVSHIVRSLTRFTDEIFSVVFSASSAGSRPVIALLTLTFCSLTFGIPKLLRTLPATSFFYAATRKNLASFAPVSAELCDLQIAIDFISFISFAFVSLFLNQAIGVTIGSLVARAARYELEHCSPCTRAPDQVCDECRSTLVVVFEGPSHVGWVGGRASRCAGDCFAFPGPKHYSARHQSPTIQTSQRPRDGMHGDMFVIS